MDPAVLIGVVTAPHSPFRELLLEVLDACDPRTVDGNGSKDHPRLDSSWYTLSVINLRSQVLSGISMSTKCWFYDTESWWAGVSLTKPICFQAGTVKVAQETSIWIPPTKVRFIAHQMHLESFMTATLYALFPTECPSFGEHAATSVDASQSPSRPEVRIISWPLASAEEPLAAHSIICDTKFRHNPSNPHVLPEWLPSSFPKEVTSEQLRRIVEELKELKQTVWYKPRNTGTSGFNIVGLTFISRTSTLEITLLDMKDEQNMNSACVRAKLHRVLCTHLWQVFNETNPEINLSIELVIAGRAADEVKFCYCPGMDIGNTPR